jgi:hypothetical protein
VPARVSRVRAAFLAAAERSAGPLVRTAFLAAADRSARVRFAAAVRVCLAKARGEAALRPSRSRARVVARERFADGVLFAGAPWPLAYAREALRRVFSDTVPFFGGGRSTPARRAFDSPMAMACFEDRAPCLPCLM